MNKEWRDMLIFFVVLVGIILLFNSFNNSKRINELETSLENSQYSSELTTMYVSGREMKTTEVCCPIGYVRTGCSIQTMSSYPNGGVMPTKSECCMGYNVYDFWAICLKS